MDWRPAQSYKLLSSPTCANPHSEANESSSNFEFLAPSTHASDMSMLHQSRPTHEDRASIDDNVAVEFWSCASPFDYVSTDWYTCSALTAEQESCVPLNTYSSSTTLNIINTALATVPPATVQPATKLLATELPTKFQASEPKTCQHARNSATNDLPWIPSAHFFVGGNRKSSVHIYFDETSPKSFIRADLLHKLGLRARPSYMEPDLLYTTAKIETCDGFFESRCTRMYVKRRCKGYGVLLGSDFINAHSINIDYIARTCRYSTLAYDVLTCKPMPLERPIRPTYYQSANRNSVGRQAMSNNKPRTKLTRPCLSSKATARKRARRHMYLSDFQLRPVFGGSPVANVKNSWIGHELSTYVASGDVCNPDSTYRFHSHHSGDVDTMDIDGCIVATIPLNVLADHIKKCDLLTVMQDHGLFESSRSTMADIKDCIKRHEIANAPCCVQSKTFLLPCNVPPSNLRKSLEQRSSHRNKTVSGPTHTMNTDDTNTQHSFPPAPPSDSLKRRIIRDFCADMSAENLAEAGCAVCACLSKTSTMTDLSEELFDYSVLEDPTNRMTRIERRSDNESITNVKGPILDRSCHGVCSVCLKDLKRKKVPKLALANGNWIGEVPEELKGLTMLEQMLISRLRHNACVIKVHASGQYKMKANAVMFSVPMPKVYKVLPPPRKDIEEIVAFIFIGPTRPTDDMHKRLPSFVRRNKVRLALEWLKLNHEDYSDLDISYDNLEEYPEEGVPVIPDYRPDWIEKEVELENKPVHYQEDWSAVDEGPCPLIVHTLTLDQMMAPNINVDTLKNAAKAHLLSGGHAIAIGRAADPESIYGNPQMYPKAFPWLFPYGLGGIGNKNGYTVVGDAARKKSLLMYHDKRFQKDPIFSLVALNHEQVKSSTTGSFVTVKKGNFDAIANRIVNADVDAMDAVLDKLAKGGQFDLSSDSEKMCFDIINDLDHVGQFVQGSRTSKRYMRNEIWSLIAARGAPSWFITFAPMDQNHPISVFNASDNTEVFPQFFSRQERARMIGNNATACARFFKFMVDAFVKHVLGVGSDHDGLFGETEGYYGTVEEQGRLTLHLHTMLWIKGSLTPQQIRDKLTSKDSAFQKSLIEYLEGCHRGSFLTGVKAEVESRYQHTVKVRPESKDPVVTVPEAPPEECPLHEHPEKHKRCEACTRIVEWTARFETEVDELLHRFNSHDCNAGFCKNPRYPSCKARFPRDVIDSTSVDPDSGYLKMRHGESMMNTFNESLTYLMMSNTDVTSLLSGTALKAVIAYTTDYITKPGLRTHTMMEIIKSVFTRNSDFLQGNTPRAEKARKLMVQIVNAMTVRQEIGSPMACAHLLGHPDHYTNYKFRPFYWRMFVGEVKRAWDQLNPDDKSEEPSVVVSRKTDESAEVVALSPVIDYELRPRKLATMSLYDWIRITEKQKIPKSKKKPAKTTYASDDEQDDDERQGDQEDGEEPSPTRTAPPRTTQMRVVDEEDSGYASEETLIADDDNDEDYDAEQEDEDDDEDGSRSKKKKPTGLPFLNIHPQHKTHRIRVLSEAQEKIPNFVGGILPRRDKGDMEEYCRAMLTLFKPWNDPLSLKAPEETWEEAFNAYDFTSRQREIMNFFHVRYECNDARDDFRSQRISQAKNQGLTWVGGQFIHELDREAWATEQLEALGDDMSKIDHAFEPTRYGQRMLNSAFATGRMKHALEAVGWVHPAFDNVHEDQPADETRPTEKDPDAMDGIILNGEEIIDVNALSLSGWRDLLAEKRKAAIAQKASGIPEDSEDGVDTSKHNDNYWEDQVRIVDKAFLSKKFRTENDDAATLIDNIVGEFTLNEEQERAFRIIANHSLAGSIADPLRMYIGGMAGTGKSQVIKSLMRFFEARGKSYAFLILAPTGSAASLVGGSTYHSALGFRGSNKADDDGGKGGKDPLAKGMTAQQVIRARLKSVEYIFIDEISMVDCQALYNISASMNTALHIDDAAFAGKNMVFAGDFAQLPPISKSGPALYSGLVSSVVHTTNSVRQQKASIGKALWHQFTVVVLLTQNMRQRTQTEEDAKFRKLLVNLRVRSCDRDDLELMLSRVPGDNHPEIDLTAPEFVHASMITRRNANRDLLNDIGTVRFARDKNQKLHTFYASDTFSNTKMPDNKSVFQHNPRRSGNIIPRDQAEKILDIKPGNTMSIPGKLTICKGLPVIIKRNEATELNVTNGAEATVVSWRSSKLGNDKNILDVVFVELKNPPSPVKLIGLPLNVVPICRSKQSITVEFPDGTLMGVNRDQVPLLPNFAMTDYASQGRTRPINIVDLEHCDTHQSVYTCLSRASTLKGTVIFRMCHQATITGGLTSGWLKQEFRELELLNEITRLRWEGQLHKYVGGNTRSTLLKSYMKVYGRKKCPDDIHPAIAWGKPDQDPLHIDYDDDPDFVWKSLERNASKTTTATESSKPDRQQKTGPNHSANTRKRKASAMQDEAGLRADIIAPPKRTKKNHRTQPHFGHVWNGITNSCAYDSLLTILANVYYHNVRSWGEKMTGTNGQLDGLVAQWSQALQDTSFDRLDKIRDDFQRKLNREYPGTFPVNGGYTDMSSLIMHLLEDRGGNRARSVRRCTACNATTSILVHHSTWHLPVSQPPRLLGTDIKHRFARPSEVACHQCHTNAVVEETTLNVDDPPPLIALHLEDRSLIKQGIAQPLIRTTVTIGKKNSQVKYYVRGLIYWTQRHFTCRIIGKGGQVYYNDGASTKRACIHEGSLSEIKDLYNTNDAQLTYVILSLV